MLRYFFKNWLNIVTACFIIPVLYMCLTDRHWKIINCPNSIYRLRKRNQVSFLVFCREKKFVEILYGNAGGKCCVFYFYFSIFFSYFPSTIWVKTQFCSSMFSFLCLHLVVLIYCSSLFFNVLKKWHPKNDIKKSYLCCERYTI